VPDHGLPCDLIQGQETFRIRNFPIYSLSVAPFTTGAGKRLVILELEDSV